MVQFLSVCTYYCTYTWSGAISYPLPCNMSTKLKLDFIIYSRLKFWLWVKIYLFLVLCVSKNLKQAYIIISNIFNNFYKLSNYVPFVTKRTGMLWRSKALTASIEPWIAVGPLVLLSTKTPIYKLYVFLKIAINFLHKILNFYTGNIQKDTFNVRECFHLYKSVCCCPNPSEM